MSPVFLVYVGENLHLFDGKKKLQEKPCKSVRVKWGNFDHFWTLSNAYWAFKQRN